MTKLTKDESLKVFTDKVKSMSRTELQRIFNGGARIACDPQTLEVIISKGDPDERMYHDSVSSFPYESCGPANYRSRQWQADTIAALLEQADVVIDIAIDWPTSED